MMATPSPTRTRAHGFTLIELLVAITLMAIVSLMAWRGLDSITRLRDHLEVRAQQTDSIVRMLGQLERDLSLRAPDMVLESRLDPSVATGQAGLPRVMPLAVSVAPVKPGANQPRLDIIRASPHEAGRWFAVRWWLDGDRLMRATGEPSGTYPIPQPNLDDAAVVIDQVRGFVVLGWVAQNGWLPLPRPADANTPVTGLQILIERGNQEIPETYRRIIAFQ